MPGDEKIILIWPEHTIPYILITLGIILFVVLLVFLFLRTYSGRSGKIEELWRNIHKFAMMQRLSSHELELLRIFFDSVPLKTQEQIATHKKALESGLLHFFDTVREDPRVRVHLLGSLFARKLQNNEVQGIADLIPGEYVTVETGDVTIFGTVEEKDEFDVDIYCKPGECDRLDKNGPAVVYLYRHAMGGYMLNGEVVSKGNDRIKFRFNGQIDFFGEVHMMSAISVQCEIETWPEFFLKAAPSETGEEIDSFVESGTQSANVLRLKGETYKVSDRGVLLRFMIQEKSELNDECLNRLRYEVDPDGTLIPDEILFRRQELFRMNIRLPMGFFLSVTGKVLPAPGRKGYYIFRYSRLEEKDRIELLKEIKAAGIQKERLV